MKKSYLQLLTLLIALPFTVFSQSGNFTVQGEVNPEYNNIFVKLYYTDDTVKVVDSVSVIKGRFELKGYISAPTLGRLSLESEDTGDRIDLFLSPGTTHVTTKDSISRAKISGTKLAEKHEKLAKTLRPLEKNIVDRLVAYRNMADGEEKNIYFTNLMTDLDQYTINKRELVHQFVIENPTSYVSLYHLDKTALSRTTNYETTYPYYEQLSPELKDTPIGQQLGERLAQAKGEWTGQPYKDFTSTTPDGKQLSLKEVVNSNKYILVDFWASWCGPCRKENPHVVKAYNAFKDQGFTVLSVSLDNDATRWKDAIEQDGMPWYHVSNLMGWKEPSAVLYGVRAIPQNLLINEQGKIVATNLRAETLYKRIEQLINEQ